MTKKKPRRARTMKDHLDNVVVRVPPICVGVTVPPGNGGGMEANHFGRQVTVLHGDDRWKLAEKLRILADIVANTEGVDGAGMVFLLRR